MSIRFLDTQLLLLINSGTANTLLDILMPALSGRGYLLAIPFLLAMILRGARQQDKKGETFFAAAVWTLLIACCAVLFAEWAEYFLKHAIARIRPCQTIEGLRLITACPSSYSMPSGHAISSFAFAMPLFFLTREYIALTWRLYPLVLASLIAFSRIYLGVHYPSDVVVGGIMGSAIGLALSALYQMIRAEEIMMRKK